jgi:regulator of sirC expression with transglutaminase-like and TPR domain
MTLDAVEIDRWERVAASSEDASLAEGALLIAAEEYQDLDIDGYLQHIDRMGATLHRRLRSDISTTEALLALNRYVFEELGFSGNADDYYDPRNSYLNDVIDRKLGIPITLAVLYIEIGRRIGLPLHGVSFPSHFLVKCVLREGAIILDPYARGASLGLEDLQQRLQALVKDVEVDQTVLNTMLAPASPRDIFARMLRNLRAIHLSKGNRLKALKASNRIITLVPGAADEYRDAVDSETVTRQIAELEPIAARLN